jgi:nitrate/nitrite transporter NarK
MTPEDLRRTLTQQFYLLAPPNRVSHRLGRRGGIALINSIGNLGGFAGPYAIGWIKDATGETTLSLVVLAACSIMAGVVMVLMGHDSKMEMAGSRMMAK